MFDAICALTTNSIAQATGCVPFDGEGLRNVSGSDEVEAPHASVA